MSAKILLNNVDVDVLAPPDADIFESAGGTAIANIRGDDFGGGAVELQVVSRNDPSARWALLVDGSFTQSATVRLDYLPVGLRLRAIFAGSAGASNVFVDVLQ